MRLFSVTAPLRRLAGLAFLLSGAFALPAEAEQIHNFTLENGLEVVVIEDHRAPVVVQMLWYRAGAADEPPGKSGIAHFLEHLMFKGTAKVPDGAFSATIEAHGGEDNAFTSWDYTGYYQRIAADRLELVMEMEADRMRGLILPEDVVLTERQVILEERAQRIDSDPGALLHEQMRAAQFLNHHYGLPVIGWRHEIAELTREDALDWYQTYYAPNNAVLIIAGDAKPEEVRALAETYYGPIAPSPEIGPRKRPSEPPQLSERRLRLADERVSDPYVSRSYIAPSRQAGDQRKAAALRILAELLGGNGQTSLLARELQFDRQIAVWTSASYSGAALDNATFSLFVLPAPGVSLAEAEAAMDAVLAKFLREGPDEAAFERLRMQIRAAEIYARDDAQGLAYRYGAELSVGLSTEDIRLYADVLNSVTSEEVMEAAQEVLNRKNAVTGWLEQPEAPAPADGSAAEGEPEPEPEGEPAAGTGSETPAASGDVQ